MTADCLTIVPLLIRPAHRPGVDGAVFRVMFRYNSGPTYACRAYVTGAVAQGRLREGRAVRVRLSGEMLTEVW